jgi:hypothetical protein
VAKIQSIINFVSLVEQKLMVHLAPYAGKLIQILFSISTFEDLGKRQFLQIKMKS